MIRAAAAAVKKSFRGSISDVASRALEYPSVWASTGSLALDRLCSGTNPGGVPIGPRMGRIVHIAGEWSTAKSLILDHLFRDVIVRLRGLAKVSETEGTRDPHFAEAIGLPLGLLVVDRPDTLELAFDMFLEWHASIRREDATIPVMWGLDSLDSTQAEKAADKGLSEGGGWHYGGGKSEAVGAGLRKCAIECSRYPTTVVIVNQTRDAVGSFAGPKKTTSGGNAPHFYSSLEVMLSGAPRPGHGYVRTDVQMPPLSKAAVQRLGLYNFFTKEGEAADNRGAVVGRYVRAKVSKTKVGTTFDTTADFYVDFARGVHRWEGLAERLMFEGRLSCGPDGASQYAMLPTGGLLAGAPDADVMKFPTKKEWLNYVAQHPECLVVVGGIVSAEAAVREEVS